MTFQRRTATRIVELVRSLRPGAEIVVGGYDPSLAPEAYEKMGVDYLVRSEGEVTFRELLLRSPYYAVSYRFNGGCNQGGRC